jgi:hypothetical protein
VAYETITLTFSGVATDDEIALVRFTSVPPTVGADGCTVPPAAATLVTPVDLMRVSANVFSVVFATNGTYYPVVATLQSAPYNVTLATPIVVGPCNPCRISPFVTFDNTTGLPAVVSGGAGPRSQLDRLMLVPVTAATSNRTATAC